jgi:3-oxoacyl-[acyl-carrier protein] reductase
MSVHVALVTGAGRGIGRAIAARLARNGFAVAVNSLQAGSANRAAAEIRAEGGDAAPFPADVADADAVDAMVGAVEAWRGAPVVLVANAGVLDMAPLDELPLEVWHRTVDVNLGGSLWCIRRVVPAMLQAGWGRVILISSIWGVVGVAGATHYGASKAGQIGLAAALGAELGPRGVSVAVVVPGVIDTEQLAADAAFAGEPLDALRARYARDALAGRVGSPSEVAALVAHLASDGGSAFNGQAIAITGGRTEPAMRPGA